jgi:hypothetical protein
MATKHELIRAEDTGWQAFIGGLDAIALERCDISGFEGQWSVKDMVSHIGAWHAEAVQVFEQIRVGTYRSEPLDIDAMNARFVEANRDQPTEVVRAESAASRSRFLLEFDLLGELTPEAEEWFVECGPRHYEEHLPSLLSWADGPAMGSAG